MFLVTEFILLLTSNLILTQALGTSTLFIAAGNKKNLFWTSVTITVFTTIGSAAAYLINSIVPLGAENLMPLFYALAIGTLYIVLLAVLYFISRKNFKNARKYVHLSAFNCAVMGTLFTITEKASENHQLNNMSGFIGAGLEAGFGFIIASLILTAAYHKLTSVEVPASFRGFPAMLIYLGIISMAVYALS